MQSASAVAALRAAEIRAGKVPVLLRHLQGAALQSEIRHVLTAAAQSSAAADTASEVASLLESIKIGRRVGSDLIKSAKFGEAVTAFEGVRAVCFRLQAVIEKSAATDVQPSWIAELPASARTIDIGALGPVCFLELVSVCF
jgi:hypothetical protein